MAFEESKFDFSFDRAEREMYLEGAQALTNHLVIEISKIYSFLVERNPNYTPWRAQQKIVVRGPVPRIKPIELHFSVDRMDQLDLFLKDVIIKGRQRHGTQIVTYEYYIGGVKRFKVGYKPNFFQNKVPDRDITRNDSEVSVMIEGQTDYPPSSIFPPPDQDGLEVIYYPDGQDGDSRVTSVDMQRASQIGLPAFLTDFMNQKVAEAVTTAPLAAQQVVSAEVVSRTAETIKPAPITEVSRTVDTFRPAPLIKVKAAAALNSPEVPTESQKQNAKLLTVADSFDFNDMFSKQQSGDAMEMSLKFKKLKINVVGDLMTLLGNEILSENEWNACFDALNDKLGAWERITPTQKIALRNWLRKQKFLPAHFRE